MENRYFEENKWWVSPYNFAEDVTTGFDIPDRVEIHDATLRDGEQTPGVVFRKEDKVRIAQMLDDVGVDRIEAGMPAVSEEDFQAIKDISKLGLKAKIFTFARALKVDIDKAVDCGAHGVVIEIPIGYPKLKHQFGWTWEDVLHKSADCINYARGKNLHILYFPYDTTRARDEDLTNVLTRLMADAPPDSIGVVDTMGCALPEATKYMVRKVKKLTGLPVEIHTHNDFGMAVATELAAVTAGAEVVHSCINGLGERTGNAALEEPLGRFSLRSRPKGPKSAPSWQPGNSEKVWTASWGNNRAGVFLAKNIHSCAVGCGRLLRIAEGPYAGLKTEACQLEALLTLQTRLAVKEPTFMFKANAYCNEQGLGWFFGSE